MVNVAFRNWGHKFLYDGELLDIAMRTAGFGNIERVPVSESKHATLRGIEHHGEIIRNEKIKFETMVFEATALDRTQPRRHPNHRVAHRRPEPFRAEIGPGRKWPPASLVRYTPNRSLPYDHSEVSRGRQTAVRPASRNGGRA